MERPQPGGAGCGYTSLNTTIVSNALSVRVCPNAVAFPGHFLTSFHRTDSFILGKEIVGEDRDIDRILRRLKLHAEGRQFGGQNS